MTASIHSSRPNVFAVASGCALVAALIYGSLSSTIISLPGDSAGHLTHFVVYGGLMFCFAAMYRSARYAALCAAGLLLLGVGIEFAQAHTGYRSFERMDMLANAAGLGFGLLLAAVFRLLRRRR